MQRRLGVDLFGPDLPRASARRLGVDLFGPDLPRASSRRLGGISSVQTSLAPLLITKIGEISAEQTIKHWIDVLVTDLTFFPYTESIQV